MIEFPTIYTTDIKKKYLDNNFELREYVEAQKTGSFNSGFMAGLGMLIAGIVLYRFFVSLLGFTF